MNKENPALLQGYVSLVPREVSRPINGAQFRWFICFTGLSYMHPFS